ncbi:energy-coupled thiamine transporter ThiT [Natroniella acetigena]|uniref:energy-coupled thiamine transporter ThiT n=1 Tax=Natroniella acetigena TaxID=52004 RepID=UPI00200AB18D|nr:energy-coupled thiamine transporter ThiT [Natroniella acetigena]MCK8828002.1 energy-coupled thiamine transporter ThiT [Natroniella acetigena]
MDNLKTRRLAELGLALALAVILNFFKIYQMPQGGSISLEMLPIIFIALRWGAKDGFLLGVAYGILQVLLGGFVVHWAQLILDYPLAFGLLGLGGIVGKFFKKDLLLIVSSALIGGTLRFLAHFLAGAIFFADYAPQGQNIWIYSFVYNVSYILPEIIITVVIMLHYRFIIKRYRSTESVRVG